MAFSRWMSNSTTRARLVLFCVTVVLALELGTVKSLGVLLPTLQEQFVTYTWVIGLAISLVLGVGSFECLLVPSLSRSGIIKPGSTLIFIGIVLGLCLMLGSLSTSIAGLMLTFAMQGLLSVAKVVSIRTLPDYFKDNIDVATALSGCGYSVGVMVMPLLTQLFLDTYGWRGAVMLLGAINLNITCCGMLIRYTETQQECETRRSTSNSETNETTEKKADESNETRLRQFIYFTSKILNVSLLTRIQFIQALIMGAVVGYGFTCWTIYLIPHAEEKGHSPYSASFLATVGGFGNLIGKISYPVLNRIPSATNRLTLYISFLTCAASLGVDPLLNGFGGLCASSFVFGLASGVEFVAVFVYVTSVINKDDLIDAYAWYYMVYGTASMTGGFTSGWLFDMTGSYDTSFVLMGALFLVPIVTLGVDDACKTIRRISL